MEGGLVKWLTETASSLREAGFPEGVPIQRTPMWAAVGFTLTLYNIITIPYRAVYFRGDNEYTFTSERAVFIFLDYSADLFFWVELGLMMHSVCGSTEIDIGQTMTGLSRVQTVRQMSMKGTLGYAKSSKATTHNLVTDSSIEIVNDDYSSDSDSEDDGDDEDELKLQRARDAMVLRAMIYIELAFYFISVFPLDLVAAAAGWVNLLNIIGG